MIQARISWKIPCLKILKEEVLPRLPVLIFVLRRSSLQPEQHLLPF